MLSCSPGACVSGGGMVMERLGGFRLCRRLPDTDGRLLPFLSAEAMVGTMLEERPARASRGAAGLGQLLPSFRCAGLGSLGWLEGVYIMLRSFPRSLGLLGSRWTDGLTDGCGSGRAAAQAGQPVRTEAQVRGSGQPPNLPILWTSVSPCIHPSPMGAEDLACEVCFVVLIQVAVTLEC